MNFHLLIAREAERHHRREAGFSYCDEAPDKKRALQNLYKGVATQWGQQAAGLQSDLIQEAVAAASTDHESQGIENTLVDDLSSFWSSSGDASEHIKDETLLYRLKSPCCQVLYVTVAIYRAIFQAGHPLYPPLRLRVEVGASPSALQPASPWYAVQPDDIKQTFALRACAPPGGYLRLRLQGKVQRQWEDARLYIAVRFVAAHGTLVPLHTLLRARQHASWHLDGRQAVPLQPAAALQRQAAPLAADAAAGSSGGEWQERFVTAPSHAASTSKLVAAPQQQLQQAGAPSLPPARSQGLSKLGWMSAAGRMISSKLLGRSGDGDPGDGAGSSRDWRQPGQQQQQQQQQQQRRQQGGRGARPLDDGDLGMWDEAAEQAWGGTSLDVEAEAELQQQQLLQGRGDSGAGPSGVGPRLGQLGGLPYALLLETLQMQQRMEQVAAEERAQHLQLVAEYQSELMLGIPLENSLYARYILAARGQQLPGAGGGGSGGGGGGGSRGQGGGGAVHNGPSALFSEVGAEEGGGWRVIAFAEELVAEEAGGGGGCDAQDGL